MLEPVAVWDHVLVAKLEPTAGLLVLLAIKCIPCACVHVLALAVLALLAYTLACLDSFQ